MIIPKNLLIPVFNREIREGRTHFEVSEGWRSDIPLFMGDYEKGIMRVDSITKDDYRSRFPNRPEMPGFLDLVQKVLHASGMVDPDLLSDYIDRFNEIVQDEEPFRRNVRFYYDTNAFMNNYFFIFRRMIPDFTKNASHSTSLGVVAELEDLFDKKLKGHFFPDYFTDLYGKYDEMFYNQPNLFGRYSRLAYQEIEYLKEELRENILTDDGVGDRRIMSAFVHDSQKYNLDGIIVTNDGTMSERAEMRMGSWLVRFELDSMERFKTKLEYFIEAVYRAAVIYGRVKINNEIVADGLWSGKGMEDWNNEHIRIDDYPGMNRIRSILKVIPEEFRGKGYYS